MFQALLIQGAAVGLLTIRLRRRILTHVGALFILSSVAYSGLGEILIAIFPRHDYLRALLDPEQADTWMGFISPAILLMTLAYLLMLGDPRPEIKPQLIAAERQRTSAVFDWKLTVPVAAALGFLSAIDGPSGGTSENVYGLQQTVGASAGTSTDLVNGFLLFVVVIAAFSVVSRFGTRVLVPTLAAQSILLLSQDSRLEIIVADLMLLVVLARYGLRLQVRHVTAVTLLLVIVGLDISAARAAPVTQSDRGITFTVTRYGGALGHVWSGGTRSYIAFTLGNHLDTNSFGALELDALRSGVPPTGLTPLVNDVKLAIPSALYPGKLNTSVESRSEKDYAAAHFHLIGLTNGNGGYFDFLPGELSSTVAYWGLPGLFVCAALFGALFGFADRTLRRHFGPASLVSTIGLSYIALNYETSHEIWFTTTRTAAAIIAIVFVAGVYRPTADWRTILEPGDVTISA